jgi:hypothetical protein
MAAAIAGVLGCAQAQAGSAARANPPAPPLAAFAARRVLVLPAAFVRFGDSLGWGATIGDPREYLDAVDAEIAFALRERGLGSRWVFPEALVRAARRNPGYAPNPHELAVAWLRPPMARVPEQLPEPFASQVRTLIALEEDAQYVLLPVEIRFEAVGAGRGRAILHVVLVDARRSRIVWMADVPSDPTTSFSPALAASAAEHLANLVVAPR